MEALETVVTTILSVGVNSVPSLFVKDPWKLKLDGPLPSSPSVTRYFAVIIELFSSFLPKRSSPNNISYFSS